MIITSNEKVFFHHDLSLKILTSEDDAANSPQTNRVFADWLPPLLLAGLAGLETLRKPELTMFTAAFTGSDHSHSDKGQQRQSCQNHVDGIELYGRRSINLTCHRKHS